MIVIHDEIRKVGLQQSDPILIKNNAVIYVNEKFEDFDPTKLVVNVTKHHEVKLSLIYSLDNTNWSRNYPLEINRYMDDELVDRIRDMLAFRDLNFFPYLWIAINVEIDEKFHIVDDIKFNENLPDTDFPHIDLIDIRYNNTVMEYKIRDFWSNNIRYPKWNLYDNTQCLINEWYDRIDAVTMRNGFACIYFKVIPKTVNHSLQVVDEKEVVAIKRFMVTFQGNQLPKDTAIYTEWDYAMAEESFAEVNWRMFRQVFGEKVLPEQDDLIFLPIVNKLFKITHVEPEEDKKFMGKVGWFNCYINKYTDNDNISMTDEMNDVLYGFDEHEDVDGLIKTTQEHLNKTVVDRKDVLKHTNEEKKAATENYTNKFIDTTSFVESKETDAIRQGYNKRLSILSINPDQNSFPVNMYDLTKVDRKVLGLSYNIVNVGKISNFPLSIDKEFSHSFNFVSIGRHNGPIWEFSSENTPILAIFLQKESFMVVDRYNWKGGHIFSHSIKTNEYYQVNFTFKPKSVSIALHLLRDKSKKLIFQDTYIVNEKDNILIKPQTEEITEINLYGGNFYIGENQLKIDDNIIYTDYINPVLQMRSFGS